MFTKLKYMNNLTKWHTCSFILGIGGQIKSLISSYTDRVTKNNEMVEFITVYKHHFGV